MFKRKVFTVVSATMISVSLMSFWFIFTEGENITSFFQLAFFISLYAFPVILLYGLPVSLLSEKITKGSSDRKRMWMSFMIHAAFGMGFIFLVGLIFEFSMLVTGLSRYWQIYMDMFIASTLTAIIFWAIDEGVRYYCQNEHS
ncbi:hypothetical protein EDD68_1274 [Melghiribacillus thermohalophilus]|uniref:Uncharacterized protein n=1 Tax=Melghiribacillus thermohalophilus TaxID=1324956 RepID=A0A4R3MSW9_9BACI|nr:hypothetical protein [Melghiribacillus thermohalophilus]TCT17586.1 hypothetical protein EDD68_1274 [Melghiribacillus thermohalophilus]